MKVAVGEGGGRPRQGGHERPHEEVMGRRVGGRERSGHREQPCKGPGVGAGSGHLQDRRKPSVAGMWRGQN